MNRLGNVGGGDARRVGTGHPPSETAKVLQKMTGEQSGGLIGNTVATAGNFHKPVGPLDELGGPFSGDTSHRGVGVSPHV